MVAPFSTSAAEGRREPASANALSASARAPSSGIVHSQQPATSSSRARASSASWSAFSAGVVAERTSDRRGRRGDERRGDRSDERRVREGAKATAEDERDPRDVDGGVAATRDAEADAAAMAEIEERREGGEGSRGASPVRPASLEREGGSGPRGGFDA
jgi:hypothetical protein